MRSSVTRPPVTEVRSADGELLLTLSRADISALDGIGWTPGEEFVVKADDGKTDLYGILFKPRDFDPGKTYPVIDFIYGGPFITQVPNTFASNERLPRQARSVAQLGFITFIVDCRGTPERGKAFQDTATFTLAVQNSGLFRSVFINYWYLWAVFLVIVALIVRGRLRKKG